MPKIQHFANFRRIWSLQISIFLFFPQKVHFLLRRVRPMDEQWMGEWVMPECICFNTQPFHPQLPHLQMPPGPSLLLSIPIFPPMFATFSHIFFIKLGKNRSNFPICCAILLHTFKSDFIPKKSYKMSLNPLGLVHCEGCNGQKSVFSPKIGLNL